MIKILFIILTSYTFVLSETLDEGIKALNEANYTKALEIIENFVNNKKMLQLNLI